MMDVPDDIREKAYKIAYRWAMPDEEALTKATAAIAAALMAEREACARIAEDYPAFGNRAIATAIRRGTP